METTKPWYASRTLWANIIGGAVAVATAFELDLGLDAEGQAAIIGGIMAVINILLRLNTRSAVTATDQNV